MNLDRLHKLQAENAVRGFEMDAEARRFAVLASRHQDGAAPRAVSGFNLFQTPTEIAARMVEIAMDTHPRPGAVLEPSAGLGRLFVPAWAAWGGIAQFVLVEDNPACMGELYTLTQGKRGVGLCQRDFLSMEDVGPRFDVVIMNPPFKQGRDIKHILHAREMLAPGGVLVSLCFDGVKQNAKLRPLCDSWEALPLGSFKKEGTSAGVVLLTMTQE